MNKNDNIPPLIKEAFLALSVFSIFNLSTQIAIGTFFDNSLFYSIPLTVLAIYLYKKDTIWGN